MLTPSTLLATGVIVVLVCGTKKLRNMGEDLGAAVRGFRKGLEGEKSATVANADVEKDSHLSS